MQAPSVPAAPPPLTGAAPLPAHPAPVVAGDTARPPAAGPEMPHLGPPASGPLRRPDTESLRAAEADADAAARRLELARKLMGSGRDLIIEPDSGQGWIYTTIDSETGEVLRVWPRAEMGRELGERAARATPPESLPGGMILDALA